MSFNLTPHRKADGHVALFTLQTDGELTDADLENLRAMVGIYTSEQSADRARRRMAKSKQSTPVTSRTVHSEKIQRPAGDARDIAR